ncbi:MAG: glycosyltransferase family 8 protein [Acidimicrobiales bacterium]
MAGRFVDVAFSIDENFAKQGAVVLASLAAVADPDSHYRVHLLGDDLTPSTRRELRRIAEDAGIELRLVEVDDKAIRALPELSGKTRPAYFRLLLPEILDGVADRVLYVDADTVFCADPAELIDVELHGRAFAAVRSGWSPWLCCEGGPPNWRELGLDPRAPYFNSGVLVMDVAAWREENLSERSFAFLSDNRDTMTLMDQQALNSVVQGEWAELPPRWNQQEYVFSPTGLARVIWTEEEVREAIDEPGIIHYLGLHKPWMSAGNHPQSQRWFDALDTTKWVGWRPEERSPAAAAYNRLVVAWRVIRHGSIKGRSKAPSRHGRPVR